MFGDQLTDYRLDASEKLLLSMIAMPVTLGLVQKAETILFHKESDTVQGVSCLPKGRRAETRAVPRAWMVTSPETLPKGGP